MKLVSFLLCKSIRPTEEKFWDLIGAGFNRIAVPEKDLPVSMPIPVFILWTRDKHEGINHSATLRIIDEGNNDVLSSAIPINFREDTTVKFQTIDLQIKFKDFGHYRFDLTFGGRRLDVWDFFIRHLDK